jgi:hypothetical protein
MSDDVHLLRYLFFDFYCDPLMLPPTKPSLLFFVLAMAYFTIPSSSALNEVPGLYIGNFNFITDNH